MYLHLLHRNQSSCVINTVYEFLFSLRYPSSMHSPVKYNDGATHLSSTNVHTPDATKMQQKCYKNATKMLQRYSVQLLYHASSTITFSDKNNHSVVQR